MLALDIIGTLGRGVLELVLPSLASVIAGFAVLALRKLAKKWDIEVTEKQEERLKQITIDAVHAVEERSHRDPTMTGEEKHSAAVSAIMETATLDKTIPNPTRAEASAAIDATLGEIRGKA